MNDEPLTASERRYVRARKLLDRRFLVTVVVLIALVGLGGWLAYEPLAEPATAEHERVTGTFEEEGSFAHQAEVQQSTSVFDEGEIVRNHPIYYTRISPDVTGTYEYAYQANRGSLDVVMDTYLLVQSVDDDGDVYWSKTEQLERSEVEGVAPEEEVTTTFNVTVDELVQEIETIEEELGASTGDVESKVVVETQATGEVDGEDIANRHTAEFVMDADSGTYSVATETDGQAEQEFVETVEAEREYGPVRAYGPLALVAVGLLGLAGLGYLRFTGRIQPTDAELAALQTARQREEFDDWISRGRFPEEEVQGFRVEVDSLEDLVDVAIDCDSRVIEDENGYFVPDGDLYYAFYPDHFAGEETEADPEIEDSDVATFEGDSSAENESGTDGDGWFESEDPETEPIETGGNPGEMAFEEPSDEADVAEPSDESSEEPGEALPDGNGPTGNDGSSG